MQRYKTIKALGDGTYGSVFKAVNRATGDIVAIKVRQPAPSACMCSGLLPSPASHQPALLPAPPSPAHRK